MDEENLLKKAMIENTVITFRQARDKSYDFIDNFATENTIKYSELLIGLNVGLVGAMSFVLGSSDKSLHIYSSFLSIFLIFSIISILFCLNYRNQVIKYNIKHHQQASEKSQQALEKIPIIIDRSFQQIDKLRSELDTLVNDTKTGYEDLSSELSKKDLEITKYKKYSEWCFSISVSAIILIIIIESGFLDSLISFFL